MRFSQQVQPAVIAPSPLEGEGCPVVQRNEFGEGLHFFFDTVTPHPTAFVARFAPPSPSRGEGTIAATATRGKDGA